VHRLTPEQRFAELLRDAPARPFVTYYDEASGERSELSVRSLANWVVKTHHLLGTELGLGVGDRALVDVPAHWISVPILLGALTAGLMLVPDGEAEVAFVSPGVEVDAPEVYAIAPDSAAVGFGAAPPAGVSDYVIAVRPQEDKWPSVQLTAGPDDACLLAWSRADVMEVAATGAAELGLAAGGRLLSTRPWSGPDDWVFDVLAPLAVGGSVVFVVNASDDVLARRADQERVTASRG
jgi:uncharacterized protein (TIGR03089 family)